MIHIDILSEAQRLMDAAQSSGAPVRTIGGVAVALHAAHGVPAPLIRPYRDIDLVTTKKGGPDTLRLLTSLGYEGNARFNALNSSTRLVAYDQINGRQVDVFVGAFHMCHSIPITARLELESQTLPLAELLLTKLQVVKLNEKDVKDILAILVDHDVGDTDHETVNTSYVASLLASDWGLWRTCTNTIATVLARLEASGLNPEQQQHIEDRLSRLSDDIDGQPKSLRWRTRARIGERAKWYDEPEEIEHAQIRADGGDLV